MDLSMALRIAEGFGDFIGRNMPQFKIDDAMLYGSTARAGSTPNDVDILLIHHNHVLKDIEELWKSRGCQTDLERVHVLEDALRGGGYPSLRDLMSIDECRQAIVEGILNVTYLHTDFFTDSSYRERMISNLFFHESNFEYGLLWNPKTKKYDIPAREYIACQKVLASEK